MLEEEEVEEREVRWSVSGWGRPWMDVEGEVVKECKGGEEGGVRVGREVG